MVAVNIRDSAVLRIAGGVAAVRLPNLGRTIQSIATSNCNVGETGVLRGSFEMEFFPRLIFPSVSVRNNAPYARYVHNGTAPHFILGKPVLVFRGATGLVKTNAVFHPGYRGNPFLRNAMLIAVGR